MGPATGHVAVQKGGRPVVALAEVASSVFLFITPPAGVTPRLTRYGSPSSRNSRFVSCARKISSQSARATRTHLAIQVFPGEREDVGQEGFDALVLRFGKPCAGHARQGTQPRARGERQAHSRCGHLLIGTPLPSLATGRNRKPVSIPGAFSFPRSQLNLILPNDSQEVGMFCLPSRPSRKTEDERERIKQEMAQAVAAYRGPIVKCPPGRAMGSSGQNEADLELLTRPRFRASGGLKTG
jgi:hypothetical protein